MSEISLRAFWKKSRDARRRGFTLLEIALVIACFLTIVVGGIIYMDKVHEDTEVNRRSNFVNTVVNEVFAIDKSGRFESLNLPTSIGTDGGPWYRLEQGFGLVGPEIFQSGDRAHVEIRGPSGLVYFTLRNISPQSCARLASGMELSSGSYRGYSVPLGRHAIITCSASEGTAQGIASIRVPFRDIRNFLNNRSVNY